jgi:hypothetical protein
MRASAAARTKRLTRASSTRRRLCAAQVAEIQYREGSINFSVEIDAGEPCCRPKTNWPRRRLLPYIGAVVVYKALGGAAAGGAPLSTSN